MDAQEHLGVELFFEMSHRFAQEVCFGLCADADVVFLCADPANVGYGKEDDSSA